jgi:pimeloyl-ACP methyl ester carboxylesterase
LAGVSDFGSRTATIGDLQNWKKEGVKYVLNARTNQQMPHFYQFYEDFEKNKLRLNIKKAIENLQIPHLILHGNKDTSVLISEAENLKKWQPKSASIIENADHVFNISHPWNKKEMSKELTEVTEICIDFLR